MSDWGSFANGFGQGVPWAMSIWDRKLTDRRNQQQSAEQKKQFTESLKEQADYHKGLIDLQMKDYDLRKKAADFDERYNLGLGENIKSILGPHGIENVQDEGSIPTSPFAPPSVASPAPIIPGPAATESIPNDTVLPAPPQPTVSNGPTFMGVPMSSAQPGANQPSVMGRYQPGSVTHGPQIKEEWMSFFEQLPPDFLANFVRENGGLQNFLDTPDTFDAQRAKDIVMYGPDPYSDDPQSSVELSWVKNAKPSEIDRLMSGNYVAPGVTSGAMQGQGFATQKWSVDKVEQFLMGTRVDAQARPDYNPEAQLRWEDAVKQGYISEMQFRLGLAPRPTGGGGHGGGGASTGGGVDIKSILKSPEYQAWAATNMANVAADFGMMDPDNPDPAAFWHLSATSQDKVMVNAFMNQGAGGTEPPGMEPKGFPTYSNITGELEYPSNPGSLTVDIMPSEIPGLFQSFGSEIDNVFSRIESGDPQYSLGALGSLMDDIQAQINSPSLALTPQDREELWRKLREKADTKKRQYIQSRSKK
jgi:hypothetical protein